MDTKASSPVLTHLGDITVETFMEQFWQKKPVLLRGVLPSDFCPIDADDLMGLATSEEADSRLIITEEWPPEVLNGPFEPEEFEDLPDREWTILVQEVDRLLPSVASILNKFRFLPNWRVDDLMVSYAAPGGGVGAHTDQYDVFLIQGPGRRRWEIDPTPNPVPVWKEDSDVAILADFEAVESWEVGPGDVLYLPPHVAHNGIALEHSMTLSVGFRAPAASEILEAVLGELSDGKAARFVDPEPRVATSPGLIDAGTLQRLREQVRGLLGDDAYLDGVIGRALTEPVRGRSGGLEVDSDTGFPSQGCLKAVSASQMAYSVSDGETLLFVSGVSYSLPITSLAAVEALCSPRGLDVSELPASLRSVLLRLWDEGSVRLG